MRIALTGNPNSGKTTMYNALTGKSEKVGNWAGVTVDKNESPIKKSLYDGQDEVIVVDLPGAYSMSPFTSEESIASDYVTTDNPDVIINIVDATNLSRSLFFTTQLLELGIPVVIALNKSDINEKKETEIDVAMLSEIMQCPIVETVSTQSGDNGLQEIVNKALSVVGKEQKATYVQETIDLQDQEAVEAADRKRFAFVNDVVSKVESRKILTKDKNKQDKFDKVITSPWLGIPFFALVMFLVFYISQTTLGTWIADWLAGLIESFQEFVAGKVEGASPILQALLVDGIIGGVGAVVGFLPLVMVMYFLIALLEDCGYMARATVVLDPIFKKVGLSGKSIIPMVVGTGCAIPGIMACRTIRSERERKATAMLAPFMPCGAKLPVIALFVGVFFKGAKWVTPLMYFTGIVMILLGALLVRKMTVQKGKKSYFIIELPEYKFPSIKRAALSMLARGKEYIVKAGTIILVCNTLVQIMQTFNWKFQYVEEADASILASIASPIGILLVPIVGIAAWQLAAAVVSGFIAKENVVGTLAVCYGLTSVIDTGELTLVGEGNMVSAAMGLTKVAALAYLMFNLYSPPCFAALGAMNAELQDKKWFWGGVLFQLGMGYTVAFFVYQIGTLITTGELGAGFVPGLFVVLSLVVVVVTITVVNNKKAATSKKGMAA